MTSMAPIAALERENCPNCGALVPSIPGFSQWCDACDWNLEPSKQAPKRLSRVQGLMARLGQSSSAALEKDVLRADSLRPKLTVSKALAFLVSVLVFALALAALVCGLLLLTMGFFINIFGLALIGLAWLARPRFGKVPEEAIAAESAPAHLRKLAEQVAAALGTRPPDLYLFDGDFNAGVTEVGLRRRRLLVIGMPLMAVLSPQERVALLGHEFGHYVNGDPRRGFITSTALETLIEWHVALMPRSLMDVEDEGIPGLMMFPVNVVMLVLAMIPFGIALLLVALIAHATQRAEYLADARAAELAGSKNFVAAFDKLNLARALVPSLTATSSEQWLNGSLWDDMVRRSSTLPERQFERYRRIERHQMGRMGVTHPPTALRIRVVRARAQNEPSLVLTHGEGDLIDGELRALTNKMQRN